MSEERPVLFSDTQRRIVAMGATALALALVILFLYGLFRVLQAFVGTFQNVLLPLAIAAILATLLRPVVALFEKRLRMKRLPAIIVLFVLILVACAGAALLAVPALVSQVMDFFDNLPQMRENLIAWAKETAPQFWAWANERIGDRSLEEQVAVWISDYSEELRATALQIGRTMGGGAALIGGLFGTIAAYAVIPVYLFYLMNDDKRDVWKDLDGQLGFIPGDKRDDLLFLVRQFSDIMISFFRGQVIIGFLLGLILAVGFTLSGLKFGLVVGMALGLLNIIPYLGTILSVVIVVPLALLQPEGGIALLGKCALVSVAGQLVTDYYLTPRIMGDKTGMGPMLIIFSIFFWGTALGGILGMILAIPLTAFFLVFWRLAREKYLPQLLEGARKKSGGKAADPAAV